MVMIISNIQHKIIKHKCTTTKLAGVIKFSEPTKQGMVQLSGGEENTLCGIHLYLTEMKIYTAESGRRAQTTLLETERATEPEKRKRGGWQDGDGRGVARRGRGEAVQLQRAGRNKLFLYSLPVTPRSGASVRSKPRLLKHVYVFEAFGHVAYDQRTARAYRFIVVLFLLTKH